MSQLSDLLAKCEAWTADAAMAMHSLSVRRAALLKDAKRLKMVAACKAILVAPKMGGEEPAASVAPGPYPTVLEPDESYGTINFRAPAQNGAAEGPRSSPSSPTGAPVPAEHQSGPLEIPKDIRR